MEYTNSVLLIDEKKGRKIASELGLKIIGTLGILILAKKKNLLQSLKDEIGNLQMSGFRMSPQLIIEILNKYEPG